MNDANTLAIAEVLRRWYDNEPVPNVIPFPSPSERMERQSRDWLRNNTRPLPPSTGGTAA